MVMGTQIYGLVVAEYRVIQSSYLDLSKSSIIVIEIVGYPSFQSQIIRNYRLLILFQI